MIAESEINALSDDLTLVGIREFFKRNKEKLVYFYHSSDMPSPQVTELRTFDSGQLLIPLRRNESGTFVVMFTNKKLAYALIEQDFKVASTKCRKFVEIAQSLKPVNGIFVQGDGCWFTVDINQLLGKGGKNA